VVVVKRSAIGPWEFKGRGNWLAEADVILPPVVFDNADLYG